MVNDKQLRVLKYIMEAYIRTGRPVGSQYLVETYRLEMSSATVRNIMAQLTESGFLDQPHTSAGRIPMTKAYRFYMRETGINPLEHPPLTRLQAENNFSNVYELLHFISDQLARSTDLVGVAMMDDKISTHGAANLMDFPEYFDWSTMRRIVATLENKEEMTHLMQQLRSEGIRFVIGEENKLPSMHRCTVGLAKCRIGPWETYMGIIGPMRMDYDTAYLTLSYLSGL